MRKLRVRVVAVLLAAVMLLGVTPVGAFADEPLLLGDVDGDGYLTTADARLIIRYAAKLELLSEAQKAVADMNGDGRVTSADARMALRYCALLASFDDENAAQVLTPDFSSVGHGDGRISITCPETASVGDVIEIAVVLNRAANTRDGCMFLTFDPSILQFVNMSSSMDGAMTQSGSISRGVVSLAFVFYENETVASDSLTLANLVFKVVGAGDASFSYTFTAWNGTDMPASGSTGAILTALPAPPEMQLRVYTESQAQAADARADRRVDNGAPYFALEFPSVLEVGETVSVAAGLYHAKGFESGTFLVSWDADVLEYVGQESNDINDASVLVDKIGNDQAGIAVAFYGSAQTDYIQPATLRFRVIGDAETTSAVSIGVLDGDFHGVAAPASYAADFSVTAEQAIQAGDVVYVDAIMRNGVGFTAGSFQLEWDAETLRYVSQQSALTGAFAAGEKITDNKAYVGVVYEDACDGAYVTVARFTFQTLDDASDETTLTLSVLNGDISGVGEPEPVSISFSIAEKALIASAHPYADETDETWAYTYEGEADYLNVTFSGKTELESGCDYLYLYVGDLQIGEYTGSALAGQTIAVPGTTFSLRLVADGSVSGYGFQVTKIEGVTGELPAVAEGQCGENVFWRMNLLGELTVEGTGPMYDSYDSIVGYPYNSRITSVTVADGVTNVPAYAFWYSPSLESVRIADSVTAIGRNAFADCGNLKEITLPQHITEIASGTFSYCTSLRSVTLPAGVKTIDEYAFANCRSMTSVRLPAGLTDIGGCAFEYCDALTAITLPASVKTIGAYAFRYCANLETATLPGSLTEISGYLFFRCESLKKVVVPDGVTAIGSYAFLGCGALTDINIPASVTHIGVGAFLRDYDYAQDRGYIPAVSYDAADGGAYLNGWLIELNADKTAYTVKSGTRCIADQAFANKESLTAVTLPAGLELLDNDAFYNCAALESVTLPNTVTYIGSHVFLYCDSLTSIVVDDVATQIHKNAFAHATELYDYDKTASLRFSTDGAVVADENFAWSACLNGSDWEAALSSGIEYAGRVAYRYKGESGKAEIKKLTVRDGTIAVADHAFDDFAALERIVVPVSVTNIGENAFGYLSDGSKIESFVVVCAPNSAAYAYATANGFVTADIADEPTESDPADVPGITEIPAPTEPASTEPETTAPTEPASETTEPTSETTEPVAEPTTPAASETAPASTEPPATTSPTPATAVVTTEQPAPTEPATPAPASSETQTVPTESTTAAPAEAAVLQPKEPDKVKVDETERIATLPSRSSAEYIKTLLTNENVRIVNAAGEEIAPDKLVGTGSKVQTMDAAGNILSEYECIVFLDNNGDGKINSSDARNALRSAAKLAILQGVYSLASDYNKDGRVNSADARFILRVAAGLEQVA